jgi:hypothetical protein
MSAERVPRRIATAECEHKLDYVKDPMTMTVPTATKRTPANVLSDVCIESPYRVRTPGIRGSHGATLNIHSRISRKILPATGSTRNTPIPSIKSPYGSRDPLIASAARRAVPYEGPPRRNRFGSNVLDSRIKHLRLCHVIVEAAIRDREGPIQEADHGLIMRHDETGGAPISLAADGPEDTVRRAEILVPGRLVRKDEDR